MKDIPTSEQRSPSPFNIHKLNFNSQQKPNRPNLLSSKIKHQLWISQSQLEQACQSMNRIIQSITKTTLLDLKTLISHTSDANLLVLKDLLKIA